MPSDTVVCTRCAQARGPEEFYSSGGKLKQPCKGCTKDAQAVRDRARATPPADELRGIEPFGLDIERALVAAVLEHGTMAAAAAAMGISVQTAHAHLAELKRRAARAGYAPGSDMTKVQPEGFHVTGVSTLYGPEGELKGQWVKTKADPEHKLATLAAAMERFAEPFRGLADPVPMPSLGLDAASLMNVVPLGDPHLGMYAWAAETGQSFDLDIAEANLCAAVDHLLELAPPARECAIVSLGDFYHADNSSNQTSRSHHSLDVDTRWSKVLGVGLRAMRRCIDRALERHERVRVICEIGNHDDHSARMLALCLEQFYERDPRVIVDTSPAKFHWLRWGKCFIGVTHGDTVKKPDLPGVMATDRPRDWGETEHRYWYTGHIHHDSVREYAGCTVESFRTLAPRDAWHSAAGYRAGQDLKLDVFHAEHGRINRHTVGIRQVWARLGKSA